MLKLKHARYWKISIYGILILNILLIINLCGCNRPFRPSRQDGPPRYQPQHLLKTPNAIPRIEPLSRMGNRYGQSKSNSYIALNKKRYRVMPTSKGYKARGFASWYGTRFHGRKTSNGEHYNMFAMTAAHPTLPLPTYVKITNLKNNKTVIVKVNDRGPFYANRLIDVSYVAAAKLGLLATGTAPVEVVSVDPRDHRFQPGHKRHKLIVKRKIHLNR